MYVCVYVYDLYTFMCLFIATCVYHQYKYIYRIIIVIIINIMCPSHLSYFVVYAIRMNASMYVCVYIYMYLRVCEGSVEHLMGSLNAIHVII